MRSAASQCPSKVAIGSRLCVPDVLPGMGDQEDSRMSIRTAILVGTRTPEDLSVGQSSHQTIGNIAITMLVRWSVLVGANDAAYAGQG